MEVSKEMLEAAAHSMLQGDFQQQQEGVNFFREWQNLNDVLITGTRILITFLSENQSAISPNKEFSDSFQFLVCCAIFDVSSSDAWYRYSAESKNEIKQNLLRISYDFSHKQNVSDKLDQIVANIAFNEWPENWPDFLLIMKNYIDIQISIKTSQNIFSEHSAHVYRTLFYFLQLISGSTKITLKRRSQLLEFFIGNLPNFFQSFFTENSLNINQNEENFMTSYDANQYISLESFLKFSSQLFLVIQNNQEITAALSEFVFRTFIEIPVSILKYFQNTQGLEINPMIHQKITELEKLASNSFNNLSLLLSKSSYLINLIPLVIQLFETQMQKTSENELFRLNLLSSSFCKFVCNLLINLTKPIFEITSENSQQYIKLINPENGPQIQLLLSITLILAPRDEFCEIFWILWNHILNQVITNKGNEVNHRSLEILRQIVNSLLPLIFQTFYDIIPCSTILSRLMSPVISSSISLIFKIAPQETINFIMSQEQSISLCFAIGILKNENFIPKIVNIIDSIKSVIETQMPDLSMISSALYALSRNSQMIINLNPVNSSGEPLLPYLINLFKEITITILFQNEDTDYHETLLLALNHMATNAPLMFTQNMEFLDILLNVSTDPLRYGKENFSRICSIISKVILTTPPQIKDQYIERFTKVASDPLLSGDLDLIVIGTQAAYSIASIPVIGSYYITKYLWDPLIASMITTSAIPDHFLFSDIVSVFSSSIRAAPYHLVRKYISKFIEISLQALNSIQKKENENEKESQPMSEPLNSNPSNCDEINLSVSVLDAFNMMRQTYHDDMDGFRDLFADSFAKAMANNPTPTFFEFFKINGIKEEEEGPVMDCACSSLQSPNTNITRAAASFLKKMISRRKDEQFINFWQPKIIRSVFLSLFDQLHNEPIVLVSVIQVIFSIYKRHIRTSSLSPIIDQIVVEAICESVGDPNVSLHIAESLRCVSNSKNDFIQLIKDFLGTYGRMNPVEMKMFDDSLASFPSKDHPESNPMFNHSDSTGELVKLPNFSQVNF